jgi:SAM-dependent methyltransferase
MNGDRGLNDLLPLDANSTAHDWHYMREIPSRLPKDFKGPIQLLDLGAGDGRSRSMARKFLGVDKVSWHGVDIGDSEEYLGRSKDAPEVTVYDGVKLPYKDDAFDVVWCKQVLEHVRYPDAVIAEVARVLKPGGLFMGSVSQLEPYHSRSIFNWTHYGIRTVLGDHGLEVQEMTPGVDGLLLMLRAVFGYHTGLNKLVNVVTPLNQILEALFAPNGDKKQDSKQVTHQRLKVAGHIHFVSLKRNKIRP